MIPFPPRRKILFIVLAIFLILGLAIQFVRPRLDNPPVTADLIAAPAVKEIIKRACYNCHSNETHLGWFDWPQPAYQFVVDDVRKGRAVLNFSHWDSLQPPQQTARLFESLFQIEFGAMPLPQYKWLHHGARISEEEIAVLKQYLLSLAPIPAPDSARQNAANEQFEKWIRTATAASARPIEIRPAYNGILYDGLSGFKYWTAISTSERFDNGTLRVIFGNDVAVKAMREGHTHPWPDGTTFAKAAWDQSADTSGVIHAGAFKQVEFMLRDQQKYASTYGWGWARWVGGLGLKPYGHDALFTTECTNCHKPLASNDHVFTFPIADTLLLADSVRTVSSSPLRGKVITTFINMREQTMSTLYGNDMAAQNARAGRNYLAGSVLSLVTWAQRDDPHWFGARIPSDLRSIEQITFAAASGKAELPSYKKYEGKPLKQSEIADQALIRKRTTYITSLKASVVPRAN
jgi:Haem-binding domain/Cytochrome P460